MTDRSLYSSARRGEPGALVDPLADSELATPPSQARQEAIQRLQIGVFGIAAMVLLVGLASIIGSQADLTSQEAVPEAAPTTEPSPAASQANPLADAGVVPDIAAEPSPVPAVPLAVPPPRPPQGNAPPAQ